MGFEATSKVLFAIYGCSSISSEEDYSAGNSGFSFLGTAPKNVEMSFWPITLLNISSFFRFLSFNRLACMVDGQTCGYLSSLSGASSLAGGSSSSATLLGSIGLISLGFHIACNVETLSSSDLFFRLIKQSRIIRVGSHGQH